MIRTRAGGTQKLVYTVAELAQLAGISTYRMKSLLANNGVQTQQGARRGGVVFVSTLANALPDLVDSINTYSRDE